MVDVDTFLTTLYVMADDYCQSQLPKSKPGPEASLCASEVITLSIFARWSRFASERDFYRYADTKLRDAFPTLPDRSQFNRCVRSCCQLIEAFALHLASLLTDAQKCPYQALDSSAMPIRDCKRRGHGWLVGQADIGWSLTAWDGTRALACSPRSIPPGSLPVFVSQPPPAQTSRSSTERSGGHAGDVVSQLKQVVARRPLGLDPAHRACGP
jgi:hypothetical protein